MGKNTLRNPPQPRNQLPRTQSLSIYPTCVTIPVTCRRCLPSLVPPYPLKLPKMFNYISLATQLFAIAEPTMSGIFCGRMTSVSFFFFNEW
jgi:hypothetical protein